MEVARKIGGICAIVVVVDTGEKLGIALEIYYFRFAIYYLEKLRKKIVTRNMDYNIREMTGGD